MTVFELIAFLTFVSEVFSAASQQVDILRNTKTTAISPARLTIV